MKLSRTIVSVFFALFLALTAGAQETSDVESHKHSLEISTGIPYPMVLHAVEPNPGSADWSRWEHGQTQEETMWPNLTVAYSYRFNKHLELSLFMNIHGYTYEIRQHPKGYTPGVNVDYDINTVTKVLKRGYKNEAFVTGAVLKGYWHNEDVWKWYSGVGFGYFIDGRDRVTDRRLSPEVILVGTHFGRKHLYGVAELDWGPAGIGPQVGVGFRL